MHPCRIGAGPDAHNSGGGCDALGFKYKQGAKSQKPFAENGEAQALSSGCHDSAVAYGISFDATKGFPIVKDTAQTQLSGNCPGFRTGVATIGFKAGQSANGGLGDEPEVAPTIASQPSALEPTVAIATLLSQMRYIVRRLTPTECERLMGLPDGYTIPAGLEITDELVAEFQRIHDTFGAIMADYAHKPAPKPKPAKWVRAWLEKIIYPATCPDSPRYKACGNGWATNQPRWILTRLLTLDGIDPFCPVRDAEAPR